MKELDNIDILIVNLFTIFCLISVLIPEINQTVIRTILGLILILFLPGYSLITFLFPKKNDLEGIERLALSFGLSIAVTPLIGLLLYYTPFGIRMTPILLSLSLFTFLVIFAAYIIRLKTPKEERFSVEIKKKYVKMVNLFKKESRYNKILSTLLVILTILAISTAIYEVTAPKEGGRFTAFYILDSNGKTSNYPLNLTNQTNGTVIIGITNHEFANEDYEMQIKLNNEVLKDENVSLGQNEEYKSSFTFNGTNQKGKQKLEFLLYKLPDKVNVYRHTYLWIYIK